MTDKMTVRIGIGAPKYRPLISALTEHLWRITRARLHEFRRPIDRIIVGNTAWDEFRHELTPDLVSDPAYIGRQPSYRGIPIEVSSDIPTNDLLLKSGSEIVGRISIEWES